MNTPNLQVMRALLAKDCRFFRVPTLAMVVISIGFYLVAIVPQLFSEPGSVQRNTLASIDTACGLATAAVTLVAAAFGGMAIAGERADRTADFLALLPITRLQIVLSKWLFSVCMLGSCLGFHLLIAFIFFNIGAPRHEHDNGDTWFYTVGLCDGFATGMFGVAWLLSMFTKSSSISACVAIAIIVAAPTLTHYWVITMTGHDGGHTQEAVTEVVTMGMGVAGICFGTSYYLRRIAP